jgi:Glycosyl hydrolase family 65 central catalytic domain
VVRPGMAAMMAMEAAVEAAGDRWRRRSALAPIGRAIGDRGRPAPALLSDAECDTECDTSSPRCRARSARAGPRPSRAFYIYYLAEPPSGWGSVCNASGGPRPVRILVETARLWLDLGFFSDAKEGKFCINSVTGPDEYNAVVNSTIFSSQQKRQ